MLNLRRTTRTISYQSILQRLAYNEVCIVTYRVILRRSHKFSLLPQSENYNWNIFIICGTSVSRRLQVHFSTVQACDKQTLNGKGTKVSVTTTVTYHVAVNDISGCRTSLNYNILKYFLLKMPAKPYNYATISSPLCETFSFTQSMSECTRKRKRQSENDDDSQDFDPSGSKRDDNNKTRRINPFSKLFVLDRFLCTERFPRAC